MAGPIIHLLVARAWVERRPALLDSPEFYLGAIAPDAIHARPGTGKAEKQATHLGNHSRFDVAPIAAYARARSSAFDMGYIVHILTDPFWVQSYKTLPGLLKEDGHTNPEVYYREMNRCESVLFDDVLAALLKSAVPPFNHPLLTGEEIGAWREQVLSHPRESAKDVNENRSISVSFVNAFVERAGEYIDDMMRRLML